MNSRKACLVVFSCLILLMNACGKKDEPVPAASRESSKHLAPQYEETARKFAQAVVGKEYEYAWTLMSDEYQTEAGHDDFMRSITRYRDGYQGQLTFTIEAGDDPATLMSEDGVFQLFVPEQHRGSIRAEAIIRFEEGPESDGWVLVAWLRDTPAGPRVLQFYQDD